MAEKYYSILTNRGKELEAQSSATGKPVIIKDFVVGDGNGQPVKPDPAQTKLVREVYRNAISALQVSPDQANQFIAQLVLATGVGGFVVREVGLLTDAGELYSVANCAAIEKPENGVSVNLQYRLAVSETASIELKVATGDGLFLRQDANLSDVKDAALSRKSLGLKGAAVLDVGKVANTVAAGDDTRIVDALQKNNNLSELVDKEKARSNLELKTAAQKDIVTSTSDTTADRVPVVGWQGLGLAAQFRMGQVSQFLAYAATDLKEVPANGAGWQSAYGPSRRAQAFIGASGKFYSRFSLSDVALDIDTQWAIHYTTLNKPTAGDVGALPIGGGTLNGGLTIKGTTQIGVVGSGILNIGDNDSGLRSSIDGQVDLWSNSAMVGYWNKTTFSFTGQIIPTNYSNFDSRYISTDGATYAGFVNGDAARPYMRHRVSNAVVQLAKAGDSYTKTESDNGYAAKTNVYTKAESDGRFQPKGSYGAPNSASRAANGWWQCGSTGIIEQWCQGATMTSEATQTITFPKAFPNACLHVEVGTLNVNNSNDTEGMFQLVSKTNTGCVVRANRAYGSIGQVAALIKAVGY